MSNFRSSILTLAGVLLVIVLAGCDGQQMPQTGNPSNGEAIFSQAKPGAEDCGGTGKVRVRPCPVTITKKHSMPVVTVSGPNVTDSAFVETACTKKGICSLGQFLSNPLAYYVYPLAKCGKAAIYAYGYDSGGGTVGTGRLEVINKDC
jgi:hypothetical protein